MKEDEIILEVNDLKTYFKLDEGVLKAVDGVSFKVYKNKVLGIVGESGCGKSVTIQSVMNIVPKPGSIHGEIVFHRENGETMSITDYDPEDPQMREIRGNEIAMIFQEPMTAFSPVHTIADQLTEMYFVHGKHNPQAARERAIELLQEVGIPTPERRIDEYTFQFSGGMRQRAMIAMAMMNKPQILIADEPTTALDVTIQAQILRLLRKLQQETGMAIIYITHNLGVIANVADEVAVMYKGKMVEFGSVHHIFKQPLHPYTRALLRSIPRFTGGAERLEAIQGSVGIPLDPPDECPFWNRCDQYMEQICRTRMPAEMEMEPGHTVACYLYGQNGTGGRQDA